MRVIEFTKLSRPIQEHLAGCVNRLGPPMPYFGVGRTRPTRWFWSAAVVVTVWVLVELTSIGFGELKSPFGLDPRWMVALYAIFIGALGFTISQAISAFRETLTLPFRPGIYVFATGILDARGHRMVLHEWDGIQIDAPAASRKVTFRVGDQASFAMTAADATARDRQLETLSQGRAALAKVDATGNPRKVLVLHDPLEDGGFSNPFMPTRSVIPPAPRWVLKPWMAAAAAGLVLSEPVRLSRNWLSDRSMFATARDDGSPDMLRAYLDHQGGHSDDATVLLARAELKKSEKAGTVDAIQAFIASHPQQISDEASASLRKAMLVEVDRVKKDKSAGKLRDLSTRYGTANPVQAEIKAGIHDIYERAFTTFRAVASDKDPNVIPFFRRLLESAEQRGPTVQIRFRRHNPRFAERADNTVKKNPYFMGTPSLPSQYFDPPHDEARQVALGKTLIERFGRVFAADILAFELGPVVADPEAPTPAPRVPTLFIDHTADLSGAGYISHNPRGIFIGLGVAFETLFHIPADTAPPLRSKLTAWRPPDMKLLKGEGSSEETVYEGAAGAAFQLFTQKFLGGLFKPGTPPLAPNAPTPPPPPAAAAPAAVAPAPLVPPSPAPMAAPSPAPTVAPSAAPTAAPSAAPSAAPAPKPVASAP